MILLGFGAITFSLWIGGRDVIAGRISGGDLSAFVFYAVLLATSGATMSELWGEMQRAAGAADRVFELMAELPTILAPAVPIRLPEPARGAVAFDRVNFRYPARPGISALEDSASASRQARWLPWSARPALARPRCSNCCCAFTIRALAR